MKEPVNEVIFEQKERCLFKRRHPFYDLGEGDWEFHGRERVEDLETTGTFDLSLVTKYIKDSNSENLLKLKTKGPVRSDL